MISKLDLSKYNIKNNDYIVVGVSGGSDSVALLDLLLNSIDHSKIVVAHVNHHVRIESDIEEEYLKNFCLEKNIIFETTKFLEYKENNFENEARKRRYKFYENLLLKYNSKFLFLAHHGDDLIETVMMKIVRGSNLTGYSGIKEITNKKNYFIIRPLLKFTKEDIITYNKENNLVYFNDRTNEDTNYTRNRYRKTILPLLKKEDPLVHLKFLKYSNILQEYDSYITKICQDLIIKKYQDKIKINDFKEEDPFIQKNIIYLLLVKIYNNEDNLIKEKHLINILNIIKSTKPNQKTNLPKGYIAIKEYNEVYFTKKIKDKTNYKIELKPFNIIDNHIIKKIDNTNNNGNDICILDSSTITLPLYIRNRKEGDYLEVKNLKGKKKVKELFIEAKIPLNKRNSYPLLVDSNDNILWVPNIKKSKFNTGKNQNYDIILKYQEKGKEED